MATQDKTGNLDNQDLRDKREPWVLDITARRENPVKKDYQEDLEDNHYQ